MRCVFFLLVLFVCAPPAFSGQCPASPDYSRPELVNGICIYSVSQDSFSASSFIEMVDTLSRENTGLKKRVSLGAGVYRFSRPISLRGSNGWLVEIVGAGANATRLVFDNANGIDLEGPYSLGLVDRLTITAMAGAGWLMTLTRISTVCWPDGGATSSSAEMSWLRSSVGRVFRRICLQRSSLWA